MIATRYVLTVTAKCPVAFDYVDVYDLTVEAEQRTIPVEDILDAIARLTEKPIFQEELTERLSEELRATVETFGTHSGVKTTCVAVYEEQP